MFSLKTKKTYQSPHTKLAEVDLEGLICQSVIFNVAAEELQNMNDPNSDDYDETEPFYFGS